MVTGMAQRGLLVVNPAATSTTRATRLVLERALKSTLDLEIAETHERGEGARIAAASTHDLIVVLGGDGTVNDVTTGLIDFTTGKSRGPRLAVVPGGSTNVFARAIGMAADAVEATAQLLAALDQNRQRTISIGGLTAGELPERTFLFSAGMGADGETVAMIERSRRPFGRAPLGISPVRYATASLLTLSRARPELNVYVNDATVPLRVAMAIATTNRTWTYFRSQPLSLTPRASFEGGLGLFTLEALDLRSSGRQLWSLATTGTAATSGSSTFHDLQSIAITSLAPLPAQADGEALGPTTRLRLRSLNSALTVIA